MSTASIKLEELQLIQCSLLPCEYLSFVEDDRSWSSALERYIADPSTTIQPPCTPPSFNVGVSCVEVWFEITLGPSERANDANGTPLPLVSLKGNNISRKEQEWWQSIVDEKMKDILDSEYPVYELVSLHLLPLLHDSLKEERAPTPQDPQAPVDREVYHVLFTSHHLISPNKRRSLQQWSSSLSITGFAKVGYPGVIYAQGERWSVEEFVSNVKAMQWLALKVRFVEPLPPELTINHEPESSGEERRWKEFQKVGEVVEEMRRIGREAYIVEMGIGSTGASTNS